MVILSLDFNTLIKLIKRTAVDAVLAKKPMSMCYGEVVSVKPLKIQVDLKMILTKAQLILTGAVQNHTVELSKDSNSKEKYTVHNDLKVGEKVYLLRCDGGQKFIVLDRVEVPK